jgi:hypothetical protein
LKNKVWNILLIPDFSVLISNMCFEIYVFIRISSMYINEIVFCSVSNQKLDHHGRDRMVVGFTTIYAINAYHH